MNLKSKIIQKKIGEAQELAQNGDILQSFLLVKEYANQNPKVLNVFYDMMIELAKKLNDMELTYFLCCKKFELFNEKNNFNIFIDAFAMSYALVGLNKKEQLSLILFNYDKYKVFAKSLKSVSNYDKVNAVESPLDKLNINTLNYWNKLFDNNRFEDIIYSNISVHNESKYYKSLLIIKAYAYLELDMADNAIKLIKSLKSFDDEVIFALIVCYQHKNNQNALKIYKERLLLLGKKDLINKELYSKIYNFYAKYNYDIDIYNLSYELIKLKPLSYEHLQNFIISAYNIGKIDLALEYLKRFEIIYPYNLLKFKVEEAIINNSKITYLFDKNEKLNIPNNADNLINLIENQNEKEIQKFFKHQSNFNYIYTKLLYSNYFSEDLTYKIINSNALLEKHIRESFFDENIEWKYKLKLLNALIMFSPNRKITISNNYCMFFGDFFDLNNLNKYNLMQAYVIVIDYFIKLPVNLDVNLSLLNFVVQLIIDCLTSKNVAMLSNAPVIASIILNIYFNTAFNEFPEDVVYISEEIKKEYFTNFNFFAKDLGLSIVNKQFYKDNEKIDLVSKYKNGEI